MRILHVIPSVAPRYGGTSTAVTALTAALNRQPGVTAELAATDYDGPGRFTPDPAAGGAPLHLFPAVGTGRALHAPQLNEWLNRHATGFDVIHSHSAWNPTVLAARRAAVRAGVPLVYTPHGMLSAYSWSRKRLLRAAYWATRERANVAAAAAFHCTSEAEAADVRAHRAATGRVRVIPHGVDAAAWTVPAAGDELRRRCGPNADGKPILLYLARLHPVKGLAEFLLPALHRMTEPAFLAVVGGPDELADGYEGVVRDTIRRLRLEDRVALLGPVSSAERWAMFDGADLYVLPSLSENFAVVIAEAMARGCPMVVSDRVQSCQHVTAAGAGAVAPLGAAELASAIDGMLADPRRRAAAGQKGREYAKREFDWDHIAATVADLYRELHRGPA